MKSIDHIARVAHEINRAYCEALGDDSQVSWDEAPDWQRNSAILGVVTHLNNDLTPEQSHEAWMEEKIANGWIWGPVKDPVNKQHPCMVPYSQLPPEQRVKDYLFRATVKALQADVNFLVVKHKTTEEQK